MTDPTGQTDQLAPKAKFPATFWTANTIELFERAAYYSMASFMVIYLKESLGMTPSLATFLNGSLLWGIIYFMPILSGTLADKFGFKRSLSVSFVLISMGYFVMGNLQRLWPGIIGKGAAEARDAAQGGPARRHRDDVAHHRRDRRRLDRWTVDLRPRGRQGDAERRGLIAKPPLLLPGLGPPGLTPVSGPGFGW